MAPTPRVFGDRKHFEGDGCDPNSGRHLAGPQLTKDNPEQLTLWTDEQLDQAGYRAEDMGTSWSRENRL